MKRLILLFFTVVFCLCAIQLAFAQQTVKQTPRASAPQPYICDDCEPPPDPCESNPIDDATFFVQQQYRDFLYREATGGELIDALPPLNSCRPYACYNTERVKMSRTMWDKAEFRQQSRTFGLGNTSGNEIYDTYDFVELSYLIYLQRPSSAPPDDYHRYGFWFWKGNLDNCLSGAANSEQASQCYNDTINAFLSSTEYRSRFGCP